MDLTATSESSRLAALFPRVSFLQDAVLRSYAQIFFNRSRAVGLLLMLSTAFQPELLVAGVLSVLLATLVARLLGLSTDLTRSGLFGYNGLLVGLGGASLFEIGPPAVMLVMIAVIATVFVTAAFHSALGSTFNLPALTLPFLAVFTLAIAAAPTLGVTLVPLPPAWTPIPLPDSVALFLESLGALFFLPRVDAGAVVFLALLYYSRVGVVLALLGFALSRLMGNQLMETPDAMLPLVSGYNFILTAIALGGVWFVPSVSSFLLATVGVLICGIITYGLMPFLTWNGIPLLILPFNVAVILLLYAMRQRILDKHPKSVDFLLGTPEENLNYFRTRLSRFGARYFVRFAPPFLGRWTCTQGVDGDKTHKGPWRHAFDFEVTGADGAMFRNSSCNLKDNLSYDLPVLACADGTVAKVVDGVPDNGIGDVNLKDNWGNLVLLYHAPSLYSMVCHLSPGTIQVKEGQVVRQRDTLGHCGNSGRSPLPHIHFQLQATPRIGAPTLSAELHEVVSEQERSQLHSTYIPVEGDVVRNLEAQPEMQRLLSFTYGEVMTFGGTGTKGRRWEEIVPDIDLYGNLLFRSRGTNATLYYDVKDTHFMVFDTAGKRESVLHLIHAALSRVPFETSRNLTWKDTLPLRRFLPWWLRIPLDVLSPILPDTGIEVNYSARREGRRLTITGESKRHQANGSPLLRTEAVLLDGLGIEQLELTVLGTTRRARRAQEQDQKETGQ